MAEATFKIVYKTTTGEYLTTDIVSPDGFYNPKAENKIMAEYKNLDKIIGRFKTTNILYYDESGEKYLFNLDEGHIKTLVDNAIKMDELECEWHERVNRLSWLYYIPQFILGGIFVVLSIPFCPFYWLFVWTQNIAGKIFDFFEDLFYIKKKSIQNNYMEKVDCWGYQLEEKVRRDQLKKVYPDFNEKS